MGRIFGTDGARGVANQELSCELAMNIGRCAATVLTSHTHHKPKVLIGKDTRISSDMLEAALVAGLCSVGADVMIIGVVPTPAVAFLVQEYEADAGIMISASHNPVEFNGIKIFNENGYKLSDSIENEIEALLQNGVPPEALKQGGEIGSVIRVKTATKDYISHIRSTVQGDLSGLTVAIDCANGSASTTAQTLFESLGAKCLLINDVPDGININDNCGSTHIEVLSKYVVENGCDVGVAFDGDADRCLAVDEHGVILDGDRLMAMFAYDMKKNGTLKNDTVVATIMSNLGFYKFCERYGIQAASTKVGDRYVLENMLENGHNLGGEQSGHIIFLDYMTTGDGQLSAVQLLSLLHKSGGKMSDLAEIMERYPQTLVNVRVANDAKDRLEGDEEIWNAIRRHEDTLAGDGRILVRCSGTEPLIRVMVEGKESEQIGAMAADIAGKIKERLG
ncbi:phosphoglucosamine mutase [Zongyangia hominis]|uniref:Phosphoglucosamine mutase n=1 Tax=Zongyangia hominis TaxID=2763677 RepID=A0A926IAK8_9FIRM|nr:phosphoglucosamine mutase [Zongyangia hominis]MBC8569220.1 phosphoglucosamine mutase [Zongyangia hominis]